MQLFSRTVHMTGALSDVMSFSMSMCEYVTDTIGREVGLWSAGFGAPVGTMVYSMRVEGLAELQSLTSTLLENEGYHAKLAEGQSMIAQAEDALAQPVHGEFGDPPPVGSYASVTRTTMAPGRYAEAVGWAVDVAQHVQEISGVPMMFLTTNFGPVGEVAWIGVAPDAATVDEAFATVNSDAEYMKRIGDAHDLFIPGSGHRMLMSRVA